MSKQSAGVSPSVQGRQLSQKTAGHVPPGPLAEGDGKLTEKTEFLQLLRMTDCQYPETGV